MLILEMLRALGAEIREGEGRRKNQYSESSGSLNDPDLFTELSFPVEFFTEAFIH